MDEKLHNLAKDKSFAVLVTKNKDASLHSTVIWIDSDGENLIYNTEVARLQFKNVQRDKEVLLTILNPANPYQYAEVRGEVVSTVSGEEARTHIDELARKYTGSNYANPIASERVKVVVRPKKVRLNF